MNGRSSTSGDRWLMARKGITEQDWNIIAKAEPTERGGQKYLTQMGLQRLPMLTFSR